MIALCSRDNGTFLLLLIKHLLLPTCLSPLSKLHTPPQSQRQHQQQPHQSIHINMHYLQLILLAQVALFTPVTLTMPLATAGGEDINQYEPRGFIPDYMLQYLANNRAVSPRARRCAARARQYTTQLRGARQSHTTRPSQPDSHYFHEVARLWQPQDVSYNRVAFEEQKESAIKDVEKSQGNEAARNRSAPPNIYGHPRHLFRKLYDAQHSNILPGKLLRTENDVVTLDRQGERVWEFFGKTFQFYYANFGRNSIDGLGMPLIASIHFDGDVDFSLTVY